MTRIPGHFRRVAALQEEAIARAFRLIRQGDFSTFAVPIQPRKPLKSVVSVVSPDERKIRNLTDAL
jgi:hypothetical protein